MDLCSSPHLLPPKNYADDWHLVTSTGTERIFYLSVHHPSRIEFKRRASAHVCPRVGTCDMVGEKGGHVSNGMFAGDSSVIPTCLYSYTPPPQKKIK